MKTKSFLIIATVITFLGIKNAHAQYYSAQFNYKNWLPIPPAEPLGTKVDVDGSPFLNEDWASGAVKLKDGRTYRGLQLKYDEAKGILYFKDKNDQADVFIDPVNEFSIEYNVDNKTQRKFFKNGFKNIPHTSPSTFFEILGDGSAQLIKKEAKALVDVKPYNEPLTRRFGDDSKYFLIVSGKVIPFKRHKKFVLANLPNNQIEVEAYLKTDNINLKNDDDLIKLFNYYNSI
jgi:hypothetical protein